VTQLQALQGHVDASDIGHLMYTEASCLCLWGIYSDTVTVSSIIVIIINIIIITTIYYYHYYCYCCYNILVQHMILTFVCKMQIRGARGVRDSS